MQQWMCAAVEVAGEIRARLAPPVPALPFEPATTLLLGAGLALLARRRLRA